MSKTPGQVAYEGYLSEMGYREDQRPQWDRRHEEERGHWENAAKAVIENFVEAEIITNEPSNQDIRVIALELAVKRRQHLPIDLHDTTHADSAATLALARQFEQWLMEGR